MIEIVIYRIEIPTEDMVEGLPTKLNRFLNELDYHAEIIDSEGFEEWINAHIIKYIITV